ncbi:Rab proteins geranylgeranyltransferase component A [Lachnellula hyalina]|uniref:Rab proteins geranylgeranyltransferase n=1 Tax=Lachnellula hyalina TaxID=1316788 RepID=A0A8H8TW21_9HELO|nr:Rab proteins geranylgeranyltransferase component A [Lachnellula hyalina]TVY24414.1 Rab proteins geranylgeranyltransferase component A [Lachnellula hyalina]
MESLSETKWDVVIEGTGLQHSLLALALSRSDKKILHVDQNEYYGAAEAAFSLQEVDGWVERTKGCSDGAPFRNATLWKADDDESTNSEKLAFSRSYTLTLSPQIIYTKSKLLALLVSSKVYRQLEFQAVGNWWLYNEVDEELLKRLPNGREDIFQDKSIDNRAKRSLMKFLKFIVDFENQTGIWEAYGDSSLQEFLSSQFQLPPRLQLVIAALTLSFDSPDKTTVRWALPRIARHLTSMGIFGPGFSAVVPKWGGGAEIAQVACRAGAVGGGVYVLGTDVENSQTIESTEEEMLEQKFSLSLSNGETVTTRHYINTKDPTASDGIVVSRIIAVISSPLLPIFASSTEGSPLAAVSVVVFPPNSFSQDGVSLTHPVYIMIHSSETGECPVGQCVLYASTRYFENSKVVLEATISKFLEAVKDNVKLLYTLYYEQQQVTATSSLDLAFDDQILDNVEEQWKAVSGYGDDEEHPPFMQFADREGMNADDDNDDGY